MKCVAALVLAVCAPLGCRGAWILVRSPHFAVYSEARERQARLLAGWLEQLNAVWARNPIPGVVTKVPGGRAIRVIEFASASEYDAYRPRTSADAFFLGGDAGDYIVLPPPESDAKECRLAAHEYGHLILHATGARWPSWFAEGFADVLSTGQITSDGVRLGGDFPERAQALRRREPLPVPELLTLSEDAPIRAERDRAEVFYAESWALVDMLAFSPSYKAQFGRLWNSLLAGATGSDALTTTYGKNLSGIARDLRAWMSAPKITQILAAVPISPEPMEVSRLNALDTGAMVAGLLLASGDVERAQTAYRAVVQAGSDDPAVPATLGSIALRNKDERTARQEWKRAIDLGVKDPLLCFEYAVLLEDAGAPRDEQAAALRRAIALKSDYDDARYKLALLESALGHPAAALEELRAMRSVSLGRQYGYWVTMSSALLATEKRELAKVAAEKAVAFASSPEQRAAARNLAYEAETDLTVQLTRDANGNLQVVTARKPHGSEDWNPFIEPGDQIRSLAGRIQKVECGAGILTGFRIAGASGTVHVLLPDPSHVLVTGGKAEFVCDAQDGREVLIQYAASETSPGDGVLRGMKFGN